MKMADGAHIANGLLSREDRSFLLKFGIGWCINSPRDCSRERLSEQTTSNGSEPLTAIFYSLLI